MSEHEFTLVLAAPAHSEEEMDRLYGCFNDGTISTSQRITRIDFSREADSLEKAIKSAVGDVERAGFRVARVELEGPAYCSARDTRDA